MRAALALALCLAAGPALAMEIPRIDVDGLCKEQEARTGRGHEKYDECFTKRQTEYDDLKGVWGKVGDKEQRACWASSSGTLVFAYNNVRRCLEHELDLKQRRAEAEERAAKAREIPARQMRW